MHSLCMQQEVGIELVLFPSYFTSVTTVEQFWAGLCSNMCLALNYLLIIQIMKASD
jgi:hypothetical protein